MPTDSTIRDHQAWLGYLQPDGLVVSPAALVDAQAILDRNSLPLQERFLRHVEEVEIADGAGDGGEVASVIPDVAGFLRGFLDWPDECLFGFDAAQPIPDSLKVPLPELGADLAPTFAFRDPAPKDPAAPWLLLGLVLPHDTDLDQRGQAAESQWSASHAQRFERLLRDTKVPIGLLFNGVSVRLVYAPHGENSGSLTFPVQAMAEVAGRPILAAFDLLLGRYRLLAAPAEARLPALLRRSRDYQSTVSSKLAQQVLDSLYELLRGFHGADERTQGALLREVLARQPDQVYSGLLTVMLRLVFLLYAEDRGLMPGSGLYIRNYSIHGLFERLRADNEHYPDTMDHRFGAWAQLVALFRTVYQGCRHPQFAMPPRSGHLFDPQRFPFLEGGAGGSPASPNHAQETASLPLIPDGVVFRILNKLLVLDGERLSYRTLDVEEIGSVYQTIMGFRLELAAGHSIALAGKRKHKSEVPAPIIVNLDDLLAAKPGDRAKWVREATDHELAGAAGDALKSAASLDDLLAALERRTARDATPHMVPPGTMILQPTDERRRSGSHYTPRTLTQPIVRKTLEPILKRLGAQPTPAQILALKVCDPAMGSAAFLVEACRQLADELVKAWHAHGQTPTIPPDEDEVLLARRIVAQRCLYGVDRNPMAVDLGKLSLWLTTLAKDHPFTFLDHALRCGDSLVGLTKAQIAAFHWNPVAGQQRYLGQQDLERQIQRVTAARAEILAMAEDNPASALLKQQKLGLADEAADPIRHAGDLAIAAFFGAEKDKERQRLRDEYLEKLAGLRKDSANLVWYAQTLRDLRGGEHPVTPFHWEIEFPEVFDRANGGFDAIVGNPPFAGKNNLLNGNRAGYLDWLKALHAESHGNADLVAHFFRTSFDLLRRDGCFGLIATNTIGQGDTRHTGLRWICTHGGTIYSARKRYKWPGQAAVIVSVVWISRGNAQAPFDLDGRTVPSITAYLFHAGGHENPAVLQANADKSFQGSIVLGMGFTFDDTDISGVANSLATMHDLVAKNSRNSDRIFPYLGGEEVNASPTHAHHRLVINFADFPLRRTKCDCTWVAADEKQRTAWLRSGLVPLDYPGPVAADWPDLLEIAEQRVKPERDKLHGSTDADNRRERWWRWGRYTPALFAALVGKERAMVISRVTQHFAVAVTSSHFVFADRLVVFPFEAMAAFACIQSHAHEFWSLFFGSTLEDRFMYAPSDCFETFPFPPNFETNADLERVGQEYYEFRAALMVRNDEGLTKTYNRFHDPEETSPDILRLRELHAAMDRAVLDAYGWTDISTGYEFLLDYEDDEAEESEGRSRKRKKPWRYRWPDAVRDEVLARLLALNAERAEEERLAGEAVALQAKTAKAKPKRKSGAGKLATESDLLAAMAFPSSDWDRALCAALLEIVRRRDGAPSAVHLDALLLYAHPEWCAPFANRTARPVPDGTLATKGRPSAVPWGLCRDYLVSRKAIELNRTRSGRPLGLGPAHAAVRREFAHDVSALVAQALAVQDAIESLVATSEQLGTDQRAVVDALGSTRRRLVPVEA